MVCCSLDVLTSILIVLENSRLCRDDLGDELGSWSTGNGCRHWTCTLSYLRGAALRLWAFAPVLADQPLQDDPCRGTQMDPSIIVFGSWLVSSTLASSWTNQWWRPVGLQLLNHYWMYSLLDVTLIGLETDKTQLGSWLLDPQLADRLYWIEIWRLALI